MDTTWWVGEQDLDEYQIKVATLPREGSHLILGPPGSGKTNLLLLRANYLALSDQPNVLILVFTRTLQEFLRLGSTLYKFQSNKVLNYPLWQRSFLHEHGEDSISSKKFDDDRKANFEKIRRLVEGNGRTGKYDAILLDEAQDYFPEEIQLFNKLTDTIYAAGDERQKIYKGDDAITTLKQLIPNQNIHELRFHYRNGRKICRLADGVAKTLNINQQLFATSQYNEQAHPSYTEFIRSADLAAQCVSIAEKISTQLKAYPDEMLGVLCPRNEELHTVWQHLERSPIGKHCVLQSGKEGYTAFDGKKHVCVSTIHSAKGLEFRAVHIAGCDFLNKFALQRNLIYTGITRAKTALSLHYSEPIPGYLESAIAKTSPKETIPDIKHLFGQ